MTEAEPADFSSELDWALRLHKAGVLEEAAEAYREILARDARHPEASFLLGSIGLQQGQAEAACEHLAVAVVGLEAPEEAQAAFADALEKIADTRKSELLEKLVALPTVYAAGAGVAAFIRLLRILGETAAALTLTDRATEAAPDVTDIWRLRGLLLVDQKMSDAAVPAFESALALAPDDCELLTTYSVTLARVGRTAEAVAPAERAADACLSEQEPDLRRMSLVQLLSCYMELKMYDAAVAAFRNLHTRAPEVPEAWMALARCLHQSGLHDEAEAIAGQGRDRFPGDLELQWLQCVYALAPIYRSTAEIEERRVRYGSRLAALAERLASADEATVRQARALSADITPYLMPYQFGEDDRALQEIFGGMLCGLSDHPELAATDGRREDGRIVVAFLSGFVWRHTNWRMKRAWLKYLDRNRFYVVCLHLGERQDEMTEEIRGYSDEFHYLPSDYDGAVAVLDQMRPDVVFYPEVGMSGLAQRLAAGRFAPVQCCAIGHPVTTGMPTMDYFISGELIEPDGGTKRYSEELMPLPGISFPYMPSPLPETSSLTREALGASEASVVYLCIQTPQKYLPADDGLYPRIARQVPDAIFIFLQGGSKIFDMAILQRRLAAAFDAAGLDPSKHLRFLPHLSPEDYQALNVIGDVYLDTPGWSGGNTTLEAIYQGLPIVTRRGREMRACVSAGMLALIGLEETIAESDDAYVDISVRLAEDRAWREKISSALEERRSILETDMRSIAALEAFFTDAVERAGQQH